MQPVDDRQTEVRAVDHEPHEALQRRADEGAVDDRDVIGDDERRPRSGMLGRPTIVMR